MAAAPRKSRRARREALRRLRDHVRELTRQGIPASIVVGGHVPLQIYIPKR